MAIPPGSPRCLSTRLRLPQTWEPGFNLRLLKVCCLASTYGRPTHRATHRYRDQCRLRQCPLTTAPMCMHRRSSMAARTRTSTKTAISDILSTLQHSRAPIHVHGWAGVSRNKARLRAPKAGKGSSAQNEHRPATRAGFALNRRIVRNERSPSVEGRRCLDAQRGVRTPQTFAALARRSDSSEQRGVRHLAEVARISISVRSVKSTLLETT